MKDHKNKSSRRDFLQAAAAAVTGASLSGCVNESRELPQANEKQKENKRRNRSRVYIGKTSNDLLSIENCMREGFKQLTPKVEGKTIFLKLNLVDYREGLPLCTDPAVFQAAVRILKAAGARSIKAGDGPALNRDTEEIARLSGISEVCKRENIEFVDLNLDDLDKVENKLNFSGIDEFLLPKSVTRCDLLISMPKLKTHHWALLTCSLKNMFGVIPGRKYGWPKNILHVRGINPSIVDVAAAAKAGFAIVDAVLSMEGDGPLNGKPKAFNTIIMGDDLTAVDTVCGLLMELPVDRIPYMILAGQVLGNNQLDQIDLCGCTIESVKTKFELPPTFEADGRPKNLSSLKKGAEFGAT